MDIYDVINSVAEARFADATVVARAAELAESVPADQREAVATTLLYVGLIWSDAAGDPQKAANIAGLTAAAMLAPVDAGAR